MHSTLARSSIATTTSLSQLEEQLRRGEDISIKVHTPQRKANYKDKARFRRVRLKEIAFKEYSVSSNAQIKKYLSVLGVKLDLRLTSAWYVIVHELRYEIFAAKAIVDALEPEPRPVKAVVISPQEQMLNDAVSSGAIARYEELEEKGIYWIWRSENSKPELVTSTWLGMWLKKQQTP